MFNAWYYITTYRVIRINVIVFFMMFIVYYSLFLINPLQFNIDNEQPNNSNGTSVQRNFGIVDILYFNTMIHTHAAIGDITPTNWGLKIIVIIHVITVYVTTCITIIDDTHNHVMRNDDTRSAMGEEQENQSIVVTDLHHSVVSSITDEQMPLLSL